MAEEQNRSWNDRYMLRLPDGMRDRIKAEAEANRRSMNAEIVATLEEKYPSPSTAQDRLVTRLQVLMDMADDVSANRDTENDPVGMLHRIKRAMDRASAQLPPEIVDQTLGGWNQPPEFE